MIGDEAFRVWSRAGTDPEGRGPLWSRWTKPVLFVEMNEISPLPGPLPLAAIYAPPPAAPAPLWMPEPDPHLAVIVDVPGDDAVAYGVRLAALGYWPVPLFNACPAPMPKLLSATDVRPMMAALIRGAGELQNVKTNPEAPPAFLLDSRRFTGGRLAPGQFDNRWVVLPQDLPSATYLAAWHIERVLLIQHVGDQPQDDLAHVLRRWQEGGIRVLVKQLMADMPSQETEVAKPSWFRSMCRVAAVLVGLRRNSTGGFGALVPVPTESSRGGHFG